MKDEERTWIIGNIKKTVAIVREYDITSKVHEDKSLSGLKSPIKWLRMITSFSFVKTKGPSASSLSLIIENV